MNTDNVPGGTIVIAGKVVSRLGLGTMRLTGPGCWGPPPTPSTAVRVLRDAVAIHGITHIDTADAYGPAIAEDLVRQALHPFPPEVLIATKVGMIRPGPNVWRPLGRPHYLRAAVEASLRRLGVDTLDLCYLHRIDPVIPLSEQVGALADMVAEGKVRRVGLSKVTPAQVVEAMDAVTVAAVQNCLNINEPDDPALAFCAEHDIPYIPYRPLNIGAIAPKTALTWLLGLGRHVAPIPGTAKPDHLRELVASAHVAGEKQAL